MLPFSTALFKVMPLRLWSELPSGASHATSGLAARYWTTWTVQVIVYGCPAMAKVEGVNWTFGRGRAVGEAMHHNSLQHKALQLLMLFLNLGGYELLSSSFLTYVL